MIQESAWPGSCNLFHHNHLLLLLMPLGHLLPLNLNNRSIAFTLVTFFVVSWLQKQKPHLHRDQLMQDYPKPHLQATIVEPLLFLRISCLNYSGKKWTWFCVSLANVRFAWSNLHNLNCFGHFSLAHHHSSVADSSVKTIHHWNLLLVNVLLIQALWQQVTVSELSDNCQATV